MQRLLIAATALALVTATAMADYSLPAMPKAFQGTWADAEGGLGITIGHNTVSFGEPLRLLSIKPCDEELRCVNIKWAAGKSTTEMYFRLIKIDKRQAVISVNAQAPSFSSLYLKR